MGARDWRFSRSKYCPWAFLSFFGRRFQIDDLKPSTPNNSVQFCLFIFAPQPLLSFPCGMRGGYVELEIST